jgi:glutamate:GABA antiporter
LGPYYAHLADHHGFVIVASLIALWLALGANVLGLKTAKWIDSAGAIGAYLLGAMLVIMAAIIAYQRGPATSMNVQPHWSWSTLNFWSQMAYALTGLELAPILGGEIRDPERNLPRSAFLISPFAIAFYTLCTLALLVIIPVAQINPLHGLAQAASIAGAFFNIPSLAVIVAILIVASALGQLSVLGSCAARLPFVVGLDRFFPEALTRLHPRYGTPYISILVFGVLATVFLLFSQLGDTLKAAYQTITDLMTIAGFIPFAYIFAAAWKCGGRWSVISGMGVTIIALVCSIVPTADVTSPWLFEAKLFGVTALLILSARIVYSRRK